MSDERLESFAVLPIERDTARELDASKAIAFAAMEVRKVAFQFCYHLLARQSEYERKRPTESENTQNHVCSCTDLSLRDSMPGFEEENQGGRIRDTAPLELLSNVTTTI